MILATTSDRPKLHALLCGAAALGLVFFSTLSAGKLDISLGSGYEFISSDFYLLSLDTLAIDPDSLETLKRSTDAANEFSLYGKVKYDYRFSDQARLEIYDRSSFSSEAIKSSADLRFYLGCLKLSNYLNLRKLDQQGEESLNNDYLTNLTGIALRPGLGRGYYIELKNSFEFTRYDEATGYFYNYNFNKLSIAFEKEFGFEGKLEMGYRYDSKQVFDSVRLDYKRSLLIFCAEYTPSWNLGARIDNEFSRKDSKKENNLDDGTVNNLELTLNYRPLFDLNLKLYNRLEYSSYKHQDYVYYNQYYWKSELKASLSLGNILQISLTPRYCLSMAERDEFGSQDFYEYSLEPEGEFISEMSFWVNLSLEFGRRIYPTKENTLFSDHNFYQFNILLETEFNNWMAFSLIASIDWERHDLETDNTALYLLSAGLEYRF